MRREFLNLFLTWEIIALVALAFVLFAAVFYFIVHRYLPTFLINPITHNTSAVYNILGITAILLALTVVFLWQFFVNAQEAVSREASELKEIVMYTHKFTETKANEVNDIIGKYICVVVNKEWKMMSKGEYSTEASKILQDLKLSLLQYSPSSANERIIYSKTLDNYEQVVLARGIRLEAIDSVIPGYFFVVIIINLLLLVISVCLLDEKNKRAPFIIALLVATMAGTNLGLTISLDFPFSGDFAVSNDLFKEDILGELYQKQVVLNSSMVSQ